MNYYSEDEVHISCEIGRFIEKRRQADNFVGVLVAEGRAKGMSWAKLGLALGTSGQAAWEKYGLTPEQRQQISRQKQPTIQQDSLTVAGSDDPAFWNGLKPAQRHRKKAKHKET